MTTSDHTGTGSDTDKPTPDEIQADIEQTRVELGETIDALTTKLDVKTRVKDRVASTKDQARARLADLKDKAVDLSVRAKAGATDDVGKPTPTAIVVAAAAGAVVAALVTVVVRRRR
jgi:ElaB/YqjD/DUF883 family membrane-anchored ribosome-binding protein